MRRPSSPRKVKKDGYHHGNLRQALVEAAVAVMAEKDVASISLREVARKAGVTPAAPYHHFADKRALLAAVAEAGYQQMTVALERAAGRSAEDSPDALARLATAYVKFALEHPARYQVMLSPELSDAAEFPAMHAAADGTFQMLLARLKKVAPPKTGDEALRIAALTLWSLVHGMTSLWSQGALKNKVPNLNAFVQHAARKTLAALIS